jgi:NAD-dependent dihydropyrimidine dehydrogenase PreA subunit
MIVNGCRVFLFAVVITPRKEISVHLFSELLTNCLPAVFHRRVSVPSQSFRMELAVQKGIFKSSYYYTKKGNRMALTMTEECINCAACITECPNTAIYEGGAEWCFGNGTDLSGMVELNGVTFDAIQRALQMTFTTSLARSVQSVSAFMRNHVVQVCVR